MAQERGSSEKNTGELEMKKESKIMAQPIVLPHNLGTFLGEYLTVCGKALKSKLKDLVSAF